MHPFFEPLSERDATLLMTLLTVGGAQAQSYLAYLQSPHTSMLTEKATALLALPGKQRIPFLARALRSAITRKEQRNAELADPTWLLHHLRGESPEVVAAVLLGLSHETARSVLKRLPKKIRQNLPSKERARKIPAPVLAVVRQHIERRFEPMPTPLTHRFGFWDLCQLRREDLDALLRTLGLMELGQAFATVGPRAVAEFCRRLPKDEVEQLIGALKDNAHADAPNPWISRKFLSRILANFETTHELLQKSGIWRLARASIDAPKSSTQVLAQKFSYATGKAYLEQIPKARALQSEAADANEHTAASDAPALNLRDSILVQVQRMRDAGELDPTWQTIAFEFHDPQHATSPNSSASAGAPPTEGEPGGLF